VYSEIYRSENGEINENTLFDMASVTKVMSTTLLAPLSFYKVRLLKLFIKKD
jgi:CubicO group peptidase (beta-lactamase class C family)